MRKAITYGYLSEVFFLSFQCVRVTFRERIRQGRCKIYSIPSLLPAQPAQSKSTERYFLLCMEHIAHDCPKDVCINQTAKESFRFVKMKCALSKVFQFLQVQCNKLLQCSNLVCQHPSAPMHEIGRKSIALRTPTSQISSPTCHILPS